MRFVRLAALFGSLVLLTATVVLVVERRGDVRDDQAARAGAASDAAAVSLAAVVDSAAAQVDQAIDVLADADRDQFARTAIGVAAVTPTAQACAGTDAVVECTADDLLASDLAGTLLAAADAIAGRVVAGVDESVDRVLVLRRAAPLGATDGETITVVVAIPRTELLTPATETIASFNDANVEVRLVDTSSADRRSAPAVIDDALVVQRTIGSPFAIGSVEIESGVDADVGPLGDSPGVFLMLIGLGSVLLVLAGATFLADRRHLEAQASTDGLTGLANRREFERLADDAVHLADRFGTGLTVMMVDLNGFKQINDTLGHQYGDLVLQGVADRLVGAVRDSDLVARWGGDEFVILLPGLDETSAIRSSAERISRSLAASPVVGDTFMRASLGAAAFPRHGATLDSLLRSADAAMYAAKTGGVDHRVADADLARRANGVGNDDRPLDEFVVSPDYVGPDRRMTTDAPPGEVPPGDPPPTP